MRSFSSITALVIAWVWALVRLLPVEWVALIIALVGMGISIIALVNSFRTLEIVKERADDEKRVIDGFVSRTTEVDDKLPDKKSTDAE